MATGIFIYSLLWFLRRPTRYNSNTPAAERRLGNIAAPTRICGFYSPDDKDGHAIVADSSGNITELFFNKAGIGQSLIANFDNLTDIGAFYSSDDKYRHVIAGTADGNIWEAYWSQNFPPSQSVIANVPGLIRITACYADDDAFFNRRVQVLTNAGQVLEIRYHPKNGVIKTVVRNLTQLVDLGGFFTPDDGFRHSIIAEANNDIREIFFNP